jgi:hypothetical protein
VTLKFRALTTSVALSIDEDLPNASLVRSLVSRYPLIDGDVDLSYALRRSGYERDGTWIACEDPLDVLPRYELDLYEHVLDRASDGWLLHAAALEIDGRAFVFAGPSGAGKTTLTLALLERGHRLLTDEMVWIDRDGHVRGLARALHVDAPIARSMGYEVVSYALRIEGAVASKTVVLPPPDRYVSDSLPLGGLIRLTHGADREDELRPLAASEALPRFWDATLRVSPQSLLIAAEVLRGTPAYRLSSTSFSQALSLVSHLGGTKT